MALLLSLLGRLLNYVWQWQHHSSNICQQVNAHLQKTKYGQKIFMIQIYDILCNTCILNSPVNTAILIPRVDKDQCLQVLQVTIIPPSVVKLHPLTLVKYFSLIYDI